MRNIFLELVSQQMSRSITTSATHKFFLLQKVEMASSFFNMKIRFRAAVDIRTSNYRNLQRSILSLLFAQ